tara:strand:+ start:2661 stop:2966 length:306 start_codon:yes stop_codon:yes gene_type:complete
MNLEYTYEIIAVNAPAKCMDVLYSSEGKEPMLVGVRLPFEGETLEAVIDSFSPMNHWIESALKRIAPEVGVRGVIKPVVIVVEEVLPLSPEEVYIHTYGTM